ncbi:MAG TPA: flagellar motor protein MotB [Fimbriimonadaceae bacterium]|nr:flagellar motor protein MotB [Fimbriimonadaceae bacterium]
MTEGTPIIVKKKKVAAHGHHGGSWKVAYADFVTAMMAFFMVLWILGMSEDQRSVIAAYFKDPAGFSKNEPKARFSINPMKGASVTYDGGKGQGGLEPIKDDEAKLRQLEKEVEKEVGTNKELKELLEHVEVVLTREGLRIELVESANSVFFDTGQATIRPVGRQLIAKIAPMIASSGRRVIVEGHTDAHPYPGEAYTNIDLSFDRAHAVWRALVSHGVRLGQYGQMRALADRQLKVPEDPFSPLNRRVTILLPFSAGQKDLPAQRASESLEGAVKPILHKSVDIAPSLVEDAPLKPKKRSGG